MRIAQITISTPYKENLRGTSGIQYHLLVQRPKDVEVTTYSFNANKLTPEQIKEVERELNITIKVVKIPRWLEWFMTHPLLIIRVFLKYPFTAYYKLSKEVVKEIRSAKYDGIWLYGLELFRILRDFPDVPRVHTLPDSEALYYYRMLGQRFVFTKRMTLWRQFVMYPKFLRLEHDLLTDKNVHYTLVGEADKAFLMNNNPKIQAHFLRHPHYEIAQPQKMNNFSQPKIRLLLAGQYNLYMQQAADEWVEEMCKVTDLQSHYIITMLGKGWERSVEKLQQVGYVVNLITYAPNYIEEICKHDIQFTPICIGTGTKGKVLDALANGLLVIGTEYAMENIEVKNGESCIIYNKSDDAIAALRDIAANPRKYEEMAEKGRRAVLMHHSRKHVAQLFFDLFK